MNLRDLMRRLIPPASYVLFLFFLTGIWLTISPFAMTTQPAGAHWVTSTINNVTLGTILIVVSLLGILSYMIFALRDVLREAQTQHTEAASASV